jgi:hypothetical protein
VFKRTRQLCLVLALGLVICLPGLASGAVFVGPFYDARIQLESGWDSDVVRSTDPGDISVGSSKVSIGPTSFNIINDAGSSYAGSAMLSWPFSGPVRVTIDYRIEYDQGLGTLIVRNGSKIWYGGEGGYGNTGTRHFSGIILPYLPDGDSVAVIGTAWGDGHVTLSNVTISAVPLPFIHPLLLE